MFVFLFCRSRTQLISQAVVRVFLGELCLLMCCYSIQQHQAPAAWHFHISYPIFLSLFRDSSFIFLFVLLHLRARPFSLDHSLFIPFSYLPHVTSCFSVYLFIYVLICLFVTISLLPWIFPYVFASHIYLLSFLFPSLVFIYLLFQPLFSGSFLIHFPHSVRRF